MYMILALRTNLIFFLIFLTLIPSFWTLAAAFWKLSEDPVGNAVLGNRLIYTSGACSFVTCILGWYLFLSIMMASLDFPFQLPGKSRMQLQGIGYLSATEAFKFAVS
jgi:hypothetical protein